MQTTAHVPSSAYGAVTPVSGSTEVVTRTESMYACGRSSILAYDEHGVTEVEPLDNPDPDTDPGSDGLTCAGRDGLIVPMADAQKHLAAEHPLESLAVAPVV